MHLDNLFANTLFQLAKIKFIYIFRCFPEGPIDWNAVGQYAFANPNSVWPCTSRDHMETDASHRIRRLHAA